jgi:hypothetical protein
MQVRPEELVSHTACGESTTSRELNSVRGPGAAARFQAVPVQRKCFWTNVVALLVWRT